MLHSTKAKRGQLVRQHKADPSMKPGRVKGNSAYDSSSSIRVSTLAHFVAEVCAQISEQIAAQLRFRVGEVSQESRQEEQ